MSLSRVLWATETTAVSTPSETSVHVLMFQGLLTRSSAKVNSTRDETGAASASVSMYPPKLAEMSTVLTTIRNGRASRGTGYLPEPSVKEFEPAGIKKSRLIQTPLSAGLQKVANRTMS